MALILMSVRVLEAISIPAKAKSLALFASWTEFVIRVAWVCDWKHLWIKTDSTLVQHYLYKALSTVSWFRQMSFVPTHIYRDGNQVAYLLDSYKAAAYA
ncbi:unnamed protein product [Malus baccata var. baccata]